MMKRKEFLSELEKYLKRASVAERSAALNYYAEYLDERGIGEHDPIPPDMATPRQIAFEILRDIELSAWKQGDERADKGKKRRVLPIIVLSILALPLALPLSITILAVIFAVIVTLLALLFALLVSSGAVFAAGFLTLITANFLNPLGALFGLGLMLMGCGFFLLGISFIRWLIRALRSSLARRAQRQAYCPYPA